MTEPQDGGTPGIQSPHGSVEPLPEITALHQHMNRNKLLVCFSHSIVFLYIITAKPILMKYSGSFPFLRQGQIKAILTCVLFIKLN